MHIRFPLQFCSSDEWRVTSTHNERGANGLTFAVANVWPSHPRVALCQSPTVVFGCGNYTEGDDEGSLRADEGARRVVQEARWRHKNPLSRKHKYQCYVLFDRYVIGNVHSSLKQ